MLGSETSSVMMFWLRAHACEWGIAFNCEPAIAPLSQRIEQVVLHEVLAAAEVHALLLHRHAVAPPNLPARATTRLSIHHALAIGAAPTRMGVPPTERPLQASFAASAAVREPNVTKALRPTTCGEFVSAAPHDAGDQLGSRDQHQQDARSRSARGMRTP
jgi:hypothetical protein